MRSTNIICSLLLTLGIGLSSHVMAQSTATPIDCSDPTKASSKDSTCVNGLGLTGNSAPTNPTASTPIKPFTKKGLSCKTPWLEFIEDGTSVTAYLTPTSYYNYSTGEYAAECIDQDRVCNNGVLSGSYKYQTCEIAPVNATCGPANGAYYTYPTSGPAFGDKCNPTYTWGGNPPSDESPPSVPAASATFLDSANNTYSWTCSGEAGGSSTSCMAYRRINASCSSARNSCDLGNLGTTSSYAVYTSYSCNCVTTTNPTTGATSTSCQTCSSYSHTVYNWTCNGINGGSNTSCSRIN